MMDSKYDETQKFYKDMLDAIKPYVRYKHDFESLAPYLTVFDNIPSQDKKFIINYFVCMVWGYKDYKKKGVRKKSITKLENAIEKYQEAIRELHNSDVSDEVVFRNGVTYSYDGYADFDDDFDIDRHLEHLPQKVKENYLTNIEILKEIEYFKNLQEDFKPFGGFKKIMEEYPEGYFNRPEQFQLIDPYDFYERYRPSKNHIKETLYEYAKDYNIPAYSMKELIDSI